MSAFGNPAYGKEGSTKHLTLQGDVVSGSPTDNIVRILPPIHSCRDTGMWKVFVRMHFGYMGENPKDPSRPSHRPFVCIQQKNSEGEIVVECPECTEITRRKEMLEDLQEDLKNGVGGPKAVQQLEQKIALLTGWLKSHNVSNRYRINVKLLKGEYGTLSVPYTVGGAGQLLEAKIQEVRDQLGIDPIAADEGVYFNIIRKGKGMFNTSYEVDIYRESVIHEGEQLFRVKRAPLSEEDGMLAMRSCIDLGNPPDTVLTAEQISRLVNSGGTPAEVDAIFKEAAPARPASTPAPSEPVAPPPPPAPPPPSQQTAVPIEKSEEQRLREEMAAMQAKLRELEKAKDSVAAVSATAPVQESTTSSVAPPMGGDIASMDNETFIKTFGQGQSIAPDDDDVPF